MVALLNSDNVQFLFIKGKNDKNVIEAGDIFVITEILDKYYKNGGERFKTIKLERLEND